VERAYSKLENELRRSPEDKEVAAELEMNEEELNHLLSQVSFTGLVALDELLGRQQADGGGSATVGDTIADRAHDPSRCSKSTR